MDPISVKQYEKIFGSGGLVHDKSSQSTSAPIDRLHSSLCNAVKRVLDLKLYDEEFDASQIDAENIDSYSTEILYGVLSKKFSRMVQIVQEDETEIEKLTQENTTLKERLTEIIKYSEQLVSKAREEVQQLLNSNTKIHDENNLGKTDIDNMEAMLSEKEEEIRQLNINQKQIIDEFVHLRDKQHEISAKSDEFKVIIADMRANVDELEARVEEYEGLCFDKQKEIENLTKQRRVLETKLKQNSLKLNNLISSMKKKSTQQDKAIDEYKRVMERNSLFVKKLAEVEKEKEILKQEISTKTDELAHVRSLNEEYEGRVSLLRGIESYMKLEQDKHYKLLTEGELLKQQINELAPHSILDLTPRPEQVFDSKKSDFGTEHKRRLSTTDEEKYTEMSPEDIQKEIDSFKEQLKNNQINVDRLEEKNNQKIETINSQRSLINQLHHDYTDKVQVFSSVKTECENAVTECNQLETEMELLIGRFNLLSDILNKNGEFYESEEYEEQPEQFEKMIGERFVAHKTAFGEDNNKEDYDPKPTQLYISPNRKDTNSGGKTYNLNPIEDEYDDDSEEDRNFLKKRPQPIKNVKVSPKKPGESTTKKSKK